MINEALMGKVKPWVEKSLGVSLSDMDEETIPIVPINNEEVNPLRGLKIGNQAVIGCRSEWIEKLRPIVDGLNLDLLFSMFGAYELARVTMLDNVGIWGPSWYLFADEPELQTVDTDRVVKLEPSQLINIDYRFFWHCQPDSLAGFAIYDEKKLVALATVWDDGEPMWEIGMDVVQNSKLKGLGRSVVGAAAKWIVQNGRTALASTAQFNVPSARTLRSTGLTYGFASLHGTVGSMNLAPQALGAPFPGAETTNLYPRWAMNHEILPNKENP